MSKEKIQEMNKAISILQTMFDSLTSEPGIAMVGRIGEVEVITVMIRGASCEIDVECKNARQMIKEVVDAVILKL